MSKKMKELELTPYKPNGIDVLAKLMERIATLEKDNAALKAQVALHEQSLGNLTITDTAVNEINRLSLRKLAQVLMLATEPLPSTSTEEVAKAEEGTVSQP